MYVTRYYVQDAEEFSFLCADGEGGVCHTKLITNATPFATPDAANDAVQDHCGGVGVIFSCHQLDA